MIDVNVGGDCAYGPQIRKTKHMVSCEMVVRCSLQRGLMWFTWDVEVCGMRK